MVEFALAFPLFLLLLLAVFDLGRMLFTYVSLTNASREMARAAAVPNSTDAEVYGAFNQTLAFLGPVGATQNVIVTVYDSAGTEVDSVTCTSIPISSCDIPDRDSAGGSVNVAATTTFVLSPAFDGMLSAVQRVSGTSLSFNLSTTTRAFIE